MVDIDRFSRVVEERGRRFLERVFSSSELASDPSVQTLAGRFAAKEAVLKAMGTGLADGLGWHDMSITGGGSEPPAVEARGRAAELLQGRRVHISISHASQHAIAIAVAEDRED